LQLSQGLSHNHGLGVIVFAAAGLTSAQLSEWVSGCSFAASFSFKLHSASYFAAALVLIARSYERRRAQMKKILLAAALILIAAVFSTGNAQAQAQPGYGTEVCVNTSLAEQAKQRFPNARIRVVPDSTDPSMNGWRIVSGSFDADGRIHTDAEELQLRQRDREFNQRFYYE
jgi:hypothetical protein